MRKVFEFSVVCSKLWPRCYLPTEQYINYNTRVSRTIAHGRPGLHLFGRPMKSKHYQHSHYITRPERILHLGKQLKPFRVNFRNLHRRENMISTKKLLQLARKWRLAAAIGRKRISFRRTNSKRDFDDSNEAPSIKKGHFVVYATDGSRFVVPLSYLGNGVVRELFAIAEEEFGIPGEGPIVLPIDSSSMAYVVSLIKRGMASKQEKALLMSFTRCNHVSCLTAGEALPCLQFTCI